MTAIGPAAHEHRLNDTGDLDRIGEIEDSLIVETGSRLERVGPDLIDRDFPDARARRIQCVGRCAWNQSFESFSECLSMHSPVPPGPGPCSCRRPCCVGRTERLAFRMKVL